MRKMIAGILAICLLSLFGCARPGSPDAMGMEEAFYLVARDVPYCESATLSQFDDVELLETDQYGRQYFLYETSSLQLRSDLTIHLICQKVEDGNAFYYEDYSYIIRTKDSTDFSDEEVQHFKERNDWGKPLDEDNLTFTPMSGAVWIGSTEELGSAILEFLDLSPDSHYAVHQELGSPKITQSIGGVVTEEEFVVQFCVQSRADEKTDNEYRQYFLALCQKSHAGFEILVCEEYEPILDCQDLIHTFKERYLYEDGTKQ